MAYTDTDTANANANANANTNTILYYSMHVIYYANLV